MKKLCTIIYCCIAIATQAQDIPTAAEQQLENLAEVTEEEGEDDAYLLLLQQYLSRPLNLNEADATQLNALRLLSPLQTASLLRHRQLFGNLISLYELQAVPYWDVATIRKLLPYVTIKSSVAIEGKMFTDGRHQMLLRNTRLLQQQKGFDAALENGFRGSRDHVLLRYKYQYSNALQWGFTTDKDAGETFLAPHAPPLDFFSAHLFYRGKGLLKTAAVGDYVINMGQGLMHWQSMAFKKSVEALAVVRQAPALLPYQSAGEFYFHRGAAATLAHKQWQLTLFAARRALSANVVDDGFTKYFTSFSTSGYHRTPSEILDRKSIMQLSGGGSLKWAAKRGAIALNTVHYHFSKPYDKKDALYNLYSIRGQSWRNWSVDYNYVWRNFYFFGEAATDKLYNTAFVNGVLSSLYPRVDVALVHRRISPRYQALYGNAFTEAYLPNNESGLYAGLTIRPVAAWRINAYADFFKSPWLKYRVDAPSSGSDYLLQFTYQPNKRWETYLRLRQETKSYNEKEEPSPVYFIDPKTRQNLRLHTVYKWNNGLQIKARLETVWYDSKGATAEKGFLCFAEIGHGLLKKLKGNARLQYFSTDGYNSRMYAYESDVLYSFSIPFFSGTGWRSYLNLNYDVSKNITVWLRGAFTKHYGKSLIGSGLLAIEGDTRSEIKAQVLWRLTR